LNISIFTASAILLLNLALAVSVYAQNQSPAQPSFPKTLLKLTATLAGLPTEELNPGATAAYIINLALSLVGIIAVIIVIYAGFLWLTSSGSEEKVTKAKTILSSALIGLLIIFSAYAITRFVISSIDRSTSNTVQFNEDTAPKDMNCQRLGAVCKDNKSDCAAIKGSLVVFDKPLCEPPQICCLPPKK